MSISSEKLPAVRVAPTLRLVSKQAHTPTAPAPSPRAVTYYVRKGLHYLEHREGIYRWTLRELDATEYPTESAATKGADRARVNPPSGQDSCHGAIYTYKRPTKTGEMSRVAPSKEDFEVITNLIERKANEFAELSTRVHTKSDSLGYERAALALVDVLKDLGVNVAE